MLVPKLRFKREDGTDYPEWEEKRVGVICSVSTGKSNTQDKIDNGQYPFYVRSPIIEHSDKYLYDEEAVITVGDGVGTGKVYHYVNGKYNLHQRCYRMYDFVNITAKYFYYVFSSHFYKRIKSMSAKTSVDSVRMDMITDMKILLPCLEEQQKIADFLSTVDEVIAQSKAEVQNLEQQKKAAMQKIFSQEVRFKREDGTDYPVWKNTSLGKIGDVAMCKRILKEQTSENGDVPFFKISTFGGTPDAYISYQLFDDFKQIYRFPQKGAILISAAGTIGKTVRYNGEDAYYQDSNIVWLEHDDSVVDDFLYQFYQQVSWEGLEGSTIKRLYNKNLLETPISLPCLEEQQKIADFLSAYDEAIRCAKQELDKWKELKKGLLQQMFV